MSSALQQELEKKRTLLKSDEHASLAKLEEILHRQHKLSGRYISDIILGANDGIITTFAVIAGAQGAELSAGVIIILGSANLLADGISMGAGNYLGTKSEIDYQKRQREKEEWEVEQFPEIEKQEIRDIFAKKGFAGADLERAVEIVTSDKERWIDVMMLEELGLVEDPSETPIKRGLLTFIAFAIAGAIPLLPFLLGMTENSGFLIASIVGGITLFAVGSAKTRYTASHWLKSGLEMLIVGALAAGAAYAIGVFLRSLV